MTKMTTFGIAVDPELLSEIEQAASIRKMSRSEFVRACIASALPWLAAQRSLDFTRLLVQMEYQQGALAMLVKDRFPENHDALLDAAIDRVEEFHGEG